MRKENLQVLAAQGTPKQRQKPISQPQERVSGANAAPIRCPRAESRIERSLCALVKMGFLRGVPLTLFAYFCAYKSMPSETDTNCRQDGTKLPHRGTVSPSVICFANATSLVRGRLWIAMTLNTPTNSNLSNTHSKQSKPQADEIIPPVCGFCYAFSILLKAA